MNSWVALIWLESPATSNYIRMGKNLDYEPLEGNQKCNE